LITFRGPGVIGGSLPDGNYTLITLANTVNFLSGPQMTQNDVNTFVRLFGAVEGDGAVDAADAALLRQAEADPSSPYAPDFEYDGKPGIDKTDIAQFMARYKGKFDPPKKAPAKFAGRGVVHHSPIPHASSVPHRTGAAHANAPGRPKARLIFRTSEPPQSMATVDGRRNHLNYARPVVRTGH
jgi:hypothetical protein